MTHTPTAQTRLPQVGVLRLIDQGIQTSLVTSLSYAKTNGPLMGIRNIRILFFVGGGYHAHVGLRAQK